MLTGGLAIQAVSFLDTVVHEYPFPRNGDIVEDDHRVNLVVSSQRMIKCVAPVWITKWLATHNAHTCGVYRDCEGSGVGLVSRSITRHREHQHLVTDRHQRTDHLRSMNDDPGGVFVDDFHVRGRVALFGTALRAVS